MPSSIVHSSVDQSNIHHLDLSFHKWNTWNASCTFEHNVLTCSESVAICLLVILASSWMGMYDCVIIVPVGLEVRMVEDHLILGGLLHYCFPCLIASHTFAT